MKSNTPRPAEGEKQEKLNNKKNWVTPELQTLDINKTESGFTHGPQEDATYYPNDMSF